MLSIRLRTILKMIDNKERLIDVGCDHALLDIEAINENKVKEAIAIDINEKALLIAKKNIDKYKVPNITLLNQDGLNNVELNKEDIVVISGLGKNTIKKILKKKKEI